MIDSFIEASFSFDVSGYQRTVQVTEVPAIGDFVHVDNCSGRVVARSWSITSGLPRGRSVHLRVEEAVKR